MYDFSEHQIDAIIKALRQIFSTQKNPRNPLKAGNVRSRLKGNDYISTIEGLLDLVNEDAWPRNFRGLLENQLAVEFDYNQTAKQVSWLGEDAMPLWPGPYMLYGEEDFKDMCQFLDKHIGELLNEKKKSLKGLQDGFNADPFEHPLSVLRQDMKKFESWSIQDLNADVMREFWDILLDLYEEYELPSPPSWGFWRVKRGNQEKEIEINGRQAKLIVPRGAVTNWHHYPSRPARLEWPILPVEQRGSTFYMVVAPIKELDAVGMVPHLQTVMSSSLTAGRILDRGKARNQWQRGLNAKRAQAIQMFTEMDNSIIANTPLLFVANPEAVEIKGSKAIINWDWLPKWTDTAEGGYRDVNAAGRDSRPMWIIDGQHRIRGGARSTSGMELNIPVILFPSDFSMSQAAKVFAEINTLQAPLKPLHMLFMQHRFQISSPKKPRTFAAKNGAPEDDNSRRNHMSYELAAFLAANVKSPLYNRIEFLESNGNHRTIAKADQWLQYTRGWFSSIIDYEDGTLSKEQIEKEVLAYFDAFVEMANAKRRNGWSDRGVEKSVIERIYFFVVLMRIYPEVRKRAKVGAMQSGAAGSDSVKKECFKEAMAPWKNIHWNKDEFKKWIVPGSGETRRSHLYWWMRDALDSEGVASEAHVHSEIRGVRGQGLYAKPLNPEISVSGGNVTSNGHPWMTKRGSVLVFKSNRPLAALPSCDWEVRDANGVIQLEGTSQADEALGHVELKVPFSPWVKYGKVVVRCQWRNLAGVVENELTLQG